MRSPAEVETMPPPTASGCRIDLMLDPPKQIFPYRLHPLDRTDLITLFLLLTVFLLTRILWIEGNFAATVYWEEDFRWVAVHEILSGPLRGTLDYQADHYQGGSLLLTLMAAGFTYLFGVGPLAFKMAAIACSTTTLGLLFLVGRKHFGYRTAVLAGLGYLAGPPLVAYWGLVVMGSHGESLIFSLGMLLLFHRLQTTSGRSTGTWLAFGLVAGAGLWFCYTAGLTLAACGLAWLLLYGFPRWREFLAALLGAAVGLIPWFIYNIKYGFRGLDRIFEMFGYLEPIDPWIEMSAGEKLRNLFAQDWLEGLVTPYIEPMSAGLAPALQAGFGIPFACGLILFVYRLLRGGSEGRQRELVYALYGMIFLAIFLGSSFVIALKEGPVTYRFFLPAAVLLSLPVAESASRNFPSHKVLVSISVAVFLLASSTATGLGATREMLRKKPFSNDFGYQVWGLLSHRKYERNLGEALAETRVVPELMPRLIMVRGIAWGVAFRFEQDGREESVLKAFDEAEKQEIKALIGGYEWTAETRMRGVAEKIIAGEQPPEGPLVLARNRWLLSFVAEERAKRGLQPPPRNWKPVKAYAPEAQ